MQPQKISLLWPVPKCICLTVQSIRNSSSFGLLFILHKIKLSVSVRSAFSNEVPLIVWLYTQQTEFSLCGRWILRPGCWDGGVLVKALSRSQMAASSIVPYHRGKEAGGVRQYSQMMFNTNHNSAWHMNLGMIQTFGLWLMSPRRDGFFVEPRDQRIEPMTINCVKRSFTSLGLRRAKWQRCYGRLTYRTSEALITSDVRVRGVAQQWTSSLAHVRPWAQSSSTAN